MSVKTAYKLVCDHLCGAELVDVKVDEESQQVILPGDWYRLNQYHFCSLECLAQWAASKVGMSLIKYHLNASALANQAAGGAPASVVQFDGTSFRYQQGN